MRRSWAFIKTSSTFRSHSSKSTCSRRGLRATRSAAGLRRTCLGRRRRSVSPRPFRAGRRVRPVTVGGARRSAQAQSLSWHGAALDRDLVDEHLHEHFALVHVTGERLLDSDPEPREALPTKIDLGPRQIKAAGRRTKPRPTGLARRGAPPIASTRSRAGWPAMRATDEQPVPTPRSPRRHPVHDVRARTKAGGGHGCRAQGRCPTGDGARRPRPEGTVCTLIVNVH